MQVETDGVFVSPEDEQRDPFFRKQLQRTVQEGCADALSLVLPQDVQSRDLRGRMKADEVPGLRAYPRCPSSGRCSG